MISPDGRCVPGCGGVLGNSCDHIAICVGTDTCHCPVGYSGDGELEGTGCMASCDLVSGGHCHEFAKCSSLNFCVCPVGYAGDGTAGGSG